MSLGSCLIKFAPIGETYLVRQINNKVTILESKELDEKQCMVKNNINFP